MRELLNQAKRIPKLLAFLRQESGGYMLLEDGSRIIVE